MELEGLNGRESWNPLCPRYLITLSLPPLMLFLFFFFFKEENEQSRGHLLSVG